MTADRVAPGSKIGQYVVRELIGAGGMGEVYRAHDTALGRDVAIKLLPAALGADPERRARFDREARVLAALNHPAIAAIYGLVDDGDRRALVLELVEGPTLAGLIERGPMPLPRALAVARQIALALEAAHDKGIVHRDLKPANVKVTGGDVVKVLDFGLAKLTAEESTTAGEAPTITSNRTRVGAAMGTPAYMSPEQTRGQPADGRADIWAFGCLLYEMLTTRRAFAADTVADTIAAVVERAPDWQALPAATPEEVRALLRRCLEKDRAHRLRDIGDVRLELEEAMTATSPKGPAGAPSRFRTWAWLAGGLAVGLGGLAAWWQPWRPPAIATAPAAAASTAVLQLNRLTFDPGLQTDPALSHDGRSVAYASDKSGNFDLYNQPVGGGNPVQITRHPAHDWQPDWSIKDQIVFRSERDGGGLYVVPTTGGYEQRVAAFGHQPRWSPDGTQILFRRWPSRLFYFIGPEGAPPVLCEICESVRRQYTGATGISYSWFVDSAHLSGLHTEPAPQHTLHLMVIALGESRVDEWTVAPDVLTAFRELGLTVTSVPFDWAPDGRALYFAGVSQGVSAVWKLDVDPGARAVVGGPHRMAAVAGGSTSLSIAATGAMAFAAAEQTPRVWWYPLDASGRRPIGSPQALTPPQFSAADPDVTPDGRQLVSSLSRPGGLSSVELRTKDLTTGAERIVSVTDPARGEARSVPHVSPDGARLVFRYVAPESEGRGRGGGSTGPQELRLIDLATGVESRLVSPASGSILATGWSADSRFVIASFSRRRIDTGATGMAVGLLPVAAAPEAERQMRLVTMSESNLFQPVLAPNGRWIAFVVGVVFRIAVVGSKDGSWQTPLVSQDWKYIDSDLSPKDKPVWSHDGQLLYFTSARGGLLNVWAVPFDPATGAIGAPFQVTRFDGPGEQLFANVPAMEIGVARGGLALPVLHPTGGIWLMQAPRR
jgi:eukaryotic-like serine/threonine-protein kinase